MDDDSNINHTLNSVNLYLTSKVFRDPVLAPDGYIYERKAITDWIRRHATSPFTGRHIRAEELRQENRLHLLAEQYRHEQLCEKRGKIVGYREPTETWISEDPPEENSPMKKKKQNSSILLISLVIFMISLSFGIIIIGFQFYPTATNVTSSHSSVMGMDSPIYSVNRNDEYTIEKMTYRYKKIGVMISTSGLYKFQCTMDNLPYFVSIGNIDLYKRSFDTSDLSMNRLKYKYGNAGIHRGSFDVSLKSGDYILVVSVTDISEKPFFIQVIGPARVIFS